MDGDLLEVRRFDGLERGGDPLDVQSTIPKRHLFEFLELREVERRRAIQDYARKYQ